MAPRTSEGAATAAIAKPTAPSQSSKLDPTAPQNKDSPSGSTTKPTQGASSSNLNSDQTKLQNDQADYIYDKILSHYDWASLPAAPAEKPFKSFFLFCSQDVYSKQPGFAKLVNGMKRLNASRLIAGNQKENGYAWEFKDANLAKNIAAGVDMQKSKMVLGWDTVAVEGKLMACRVPFVV